MFFDLGVGEEGGRWDEPQPRMNLDMGNAAVHILFSLKNTRDIASSFRAPVPGIPAGLVANLSFV